jgi:hypothetical protein
MRVGMKGQSCGFDHKEHTASQRCSLNRTETREKKKIPAARTSIGDLGRHHEQSLPRSLSGPVHLGAATDERPH